MATVIYPAIVERAGDTYSVYFPDLPGCTSAGDTVTEAALNAEEALEGHLLVAAKQGFDVSSPSAVEDIPHDPDVDEVARILVRVEAPGKSVRIQITMDEGLVAAIDRVASNRSGFLADAARHELSRQRELVAA